jgi:UBX domain-containing protein 1
MFLSNPVCNANLDRDPPRPGGDDEEQAGSSHFAGRGVTLGGDDAPSEVIDGATPPPQPRPRVRRTLHLWRDGFSVDDGPLFRYDDPQNQQTLDMIHRGRAPIHLLNVEHGQEVDLELDVQKEQDYIAPKQKYKPFSGAGHRLGSPTPGPSITTRAPAPSPSPAASTAPSAPPAFTLDESQPVVQLQLRLGDGRRVQQRFNTSHTIGDVYDFVDQSSGGPGRAYALMTTFPNKDFEDKSAVLGDQPEFKRGGVMVQKWK